LHRRSTYLEPDSIVGAGFVGSDRGDWHSDRGLGRAHPIELALLTGTTLGGSHYGCIFGFLLEILEGLGLATIYRCHTP
jgi:hypothetical protein